MPPTSVNTMPRAIEPPPPIDVGFRDFVPDDDAANFNSALWKTIDQDAFILAQQEALDAFNVAKVLKLSKETAALEQQVRGAVKADAPIASSSGSTPSALTSTSAAAGPATKSTTTATLKANTATPAHQIWLPERMSATGTAQVHSSGSRAAASQPLSINPKKDAAHSDEAAARSLARSWQVEAIQPALLEAKATPSSSTLMKPPKQPPSSSSSSPASTSTSPSNAVPQDKRAPVVASKQPSSPQNVNLSLSISSPSASSSSHAQGASDSFHSRISSSQSQSHSQSNSTSTSQAHRSALSKRDPSAEARGPVASTTASPAGSSTRTQPSTSTDTSKNASPQQRRRGERKVSFSVSTSAATSAGTQVPPAPYTATASHFSVPSSASASVSPSVSASSSNSTATNAAATTYQQLNTSASHGQGHKGSGSGSCSNPTATVQATASATQPTSTATAPAVAKPPRKMSSAARDGKPALVHAQVGKEKEKEKDTPAPAPASASAAQQRPRRRSAPEQGQESEQQQGSRKEKEARKEEKKEKEPKREEHPFDIFTATRPCANCGMAVESPRAAVTAPPDPFSLPFAERLHLTCTGCGTVHCRGCFKIVQCGSSGSGFSSASAAARGHSHSVSTSMALTVVSKTPSSKTASSKPQSIARAQPPCSGGPGCAVSTCCVGVRAVAIFEALASFDEIFALEAGFTHVPEKSSKERGKGKDHESTRALRQAYVKLLISKADKSMRRFEDAFIRTLKILCSWLHPPAPAQMYPSSWPSTTASTPFHPATSSSTSSTFFGPLPASIPHLFHASYLPEVIHAFLSNTNVRDWIAHAETYLSVLEIVRRLSDAGLSPTLLVLPMRRVERGAGVGGWVWGARAIEWEVLEEDPKASVSGHSYLSAQERAERAQERAPLSELVKQLERHRHPLMALAEKVQFSGTVEKVNLLCDSISYLLLQQVVGGL